MTAARVKGLIVLLLAVATYAGAQAWRPNARLADTRPKVNLEMLFPKAFGEWALEENMPVQLISPDTEALLATIYNQMLSRTYVDREGNRIMLSVAYGGDQSDATRAHRPEVCYPAQGFQILSRQTATLQISQQSIRVAQLVAKLGGRIEPITYWVVVGERVAVSGTEQKLEQLRYTLRGVVPDGMLVRISSISAEPAKAYAAHRNFVDQLSTALPAAHKAQIIGSAGA